MHEIDNLSECLLEWKTLAKQHYKELERLKAENKVLWDEREEPHQRIALYISECNRLEAERDALRAELDALKGDENVGLDRQEPNKSNLAEFDLDGAFLSANVRKPLEQALLNAPKPTIELVGVDEYGPRLNWYTHWANFSDGQKFYTRPEVAEKNIAMKERMEKMEAALRIAVRQNSHDMLMTGDELRQCEAALEKSK